MLECLLGIMLCVCETCHAIKLIGLETFKWQRSAVVSNIRNH